MIHVGYRIFGDVARHNGLMPSIVTHAFRRFPCPVLVLPHSATVAMTVSVLGSGSRGNATFVKTDRIRLLIDAGLSRKEIGRRLEAIGEDPDGIDAVLITHEHTDHASGLKMLLKELSLEAFLTWGTIGAIE